MKVIEIAFPSVAIPARLSTKELIDFVVDSKQFKLVKNFREYAAKLISDPAHLHELTQQVQSDMMELDNEVRKETTVRTLGTIKLVFGNILGLVEDIVKLKPSSLVERPLTVTEQIVTRYYGGPSYEKNPLYIVSALKSKLDVR
jgi:hypothetical protein